MLDAACPREEFFANLPANAIKNSISKFTKITPLEWETVSLAAETLRSIAGSFGNWFKLFAVTMQANLFVNSDHTKNGLLQIVIQSPHGHSSNGIAFGEIRHLFGLNIGKQSGINLNEHRYEKILLCFTKDFYIMH